MDLVSEALKTASPYARHLGIFNPHRLQLSASIIGCGAIGSFVSIGLAKMGVVDQMLFDMDQVEIENLPVQLHSREHLGLNKAEATKAMIALLAPEGDSKVSAFGKWEGQSLKSDIVVAAVDDLEVRKAIWEGVRYDSAVKILLDARIGGQMAKCYAISPTSPEDIKLYDKTFPKGDMKGADLPCTERGVLDVSMFTSAVLINQMRRYIVSHEKESYLAFNFSGPMKNIM
jgi:molybdopterin/thiamine biosynthesis adenylyltransferase